MNHSYDPHTFKSIIIENKLSDSAFTQAITLLADGIVKFLRGFCERTVKPIDKIMLGKTSSTDQTVYRKSHIDVDQQQNPQIPTVYQQLINMFAFIAHSLISENHIYRPTFV